MKKNTDIRQEDVPESDRSDDSSETNQAAGGIIDPAGVAASLTMLMITVVWWLENMRDV